MLATLSRHLYSGWSLYIEGRPASAHIGEVTLDQSLSHMALTKAAMHRIAEIASKSDEPIDLHVVDDRQRSGLRHPSQGKYHNIRIHDVPPRDALTRKARLVIEEKYREAVKQSPFDGDPSKPFLISTAVEMHRYHGSNASFILDAAGTGIVIAAAGDIHTSRHVVKVPRHDNIIAELFAIQSALSMAMKKLPSFRSTREGAVICTTSQEALDAIAYPWGGSKARRIAAGKVIEQLNRVKCGEKMDRYAATFRLIEEGSMPYHMASKELARISVTDYTTVTKFGRHHLSNHHDSDKLEEIVRDNLIGALSGKPERDIAVHDLAPVSNVAPLFHFPDHKRKKNTLL